jgi:hypothetical protein
VAGIERPSRRRGIFGIGAWIETLKFMGDGALAIFPAADDADFSEASIQALEAALEGLERLGMVNRRDAKPSEPRLESGSACIWAKSFLATSAPVTGSTLQ